ncbi:hypothetical protein DKX38_018939 [Salix brachista]|uniref:HIT domain-containing protein n=1 Tax=Salix brachista TaxID=2182728 RepID=A0A5N5KPF8_9ROSI|nr:hypothetical protein DKX38_018939 [Salix brachista]
MAADPMYEEGILVLAGPLFSIIRDEKVVAFRDINPQAPVHVLVIPKNRDGLTQPGKLSNLKLGGSKTWGVVAEKEGILDGFRVVINNGPDACKFTPRFCNFLPVLVSFPSIDVLIVHSVSLSPGQSVYHLHLHVLGGRQMKWPPGFFKIQREVEINGTCNNEESREKKKEEEPAACGCQMVLGLHCKDLCLKVRIVMQHEKIKDESMKVKEEQKNSYLEGWWSTVMHLPETLWTERAALMMARFARAVWKRRGEECMNGLVEVVGDWM